MEKELLNQVIEKTKKLIEAPTCCADLKEAASAWLHAVGTVDRIVQYLENELLMNNRAAIIMPQKETYYEKSIENIRNFR